MVAHPGVDAQADASRLSRGWATGQIVGDRRKAPRTRARREGGEPPRARRRESAFTLIELLIVTAILAVLSAIATSQILSAREKTRIARAEADLNGIVKAFERLHDDTGQYPDHTPSGAPCRVPGDASEAHVHDPVMGIVTNDPISPYANWKGPYIVNPVRDPIDGVLKVLDPWGKPYVYDPDYTWNDAMFRVVHSGGPNRSGMNVYDADNIVRPLCQWEG